MTGSDITVVICTVGSPRRQLLRRALESVWAQSLQPDAIVVVQDNDRRGAPHTRQAGTDCVQTRYVAYLDDDDEFLPQHLLHLRDAIGDADLIYPWFDVINGTDPFPHLFGQLWDDEHPHQVPVTSLSRVESIRRAGGWLTDWATVAAAEDPGTDADGNRAGEDYQLILRMIAHRMQIKHLPERTWLWHHGGNTMGLPSRVDWNRTG